MEKKFDITLSIHKPKNSAIKKDIQSLFWMLEAECIILIDSKVFFKDEYLNILEFIAWFSKSFVKSRTGDNLQFKSVDHDEPIIEIYKTSSDTCEISSIWSYSANKKIITRTTEVLSAFKKIYKQTGDWLLQVYGIKMTTLKDGTILLKQE